MLRTTLVIVIALSSACGLPKFDPPDAPAHSKKEDGFLHGRRLESPFSCGDPQKPTRAVACPTERPPDELLSCDAIGCHGGFEFGAAPNPASRHLRGSEGPSCYTCHGNKWDEKEDD